MAPGLAPRVRWIDGSATLTTKKSRMKTKVPHIMTASGAHLAHARTGAGRPVPRSDLVLVADRTMSLRPPITGGSSHPVEVKQLAGSAAQGPDQGGSDAGRHEPPGVDAGLVNHQRGHRQRGDHYGGDMPVVPDHEVLPDLPDCLQPRHHAAALSA